MSTLSKLMGNTAVKAPEKEQGADVAVVDQSTKSLTIAQVRADAALFASQMGADIVDTIVETMDAAETVKRNPLLIMFMLEDRFDGQEGRRKLSDCPVPGSKTGNNPDHVEDKEKNAAGELKPVKTSFWREVANNMEEGKAVKVLLEAVNGKTGRWEVGAEGAATEWRRVQEKKRLETRLSGLTAIVRKAASLYFQVQDVQSLPHVEITFGTDTNDEGETVLANITSPVTIYDPKKPGTFETMSVGQFLQLDPAEAAKNGGTYTALVKTLGREGSSGQGGDKGKEHLIKSIDQLLSLLDNVHIYLDPETPDGQKHRAALAQFMANPKLGEDAIVTIGNAQMAIDAPFTRVSDRYTDILNRKAGTTGTREKLIEGAKARENKTA